MTGFASERFKWGINIDNMWVYAGAPQPKSIGVHIRPEKIPKELLHAIRRNKQQAQAGEDSHEENRMDTQEEINEASRRLALELKKNGIDFLRCWFQWNFFQRNVRDETFRFPLDDFVSILKSQGIEILAVIANGYSRFLPEGLSEDDPAEYLNRASAASAEIVRHYKSSIKAWQIENEPNWWIPHQASGWRHGSIWNKPGFKESILEVLQRAVRAEDPSATIVVNLEADMKKTDWKSYSKYCDVIGLDFYPNYAKATPIEAKDFRFSSKVRSEAGLPVFIAETGYPSGPSIAGYSEENQAAYVANACEEAFSCNEINGIAIWRYSDSYWRSSPEQENHFGLRTRDGKPKLGWNEYCKQIGAKKQIRHEASATV